MSDECNPRAAVTVLHVSTALGWRGGERQLMWLSERLHSAGVRSIVAARPGEPLAAKLRERGLPLVPLALRGPWDPGAVIKLRRVIRAHRVEIVHAHDGHATTLAWLAVGRGRARFVVTRRNYRRPGGRAWKYRRADAVIAVSRFVADRLEDAGVERDRIVVVYSGVDLERRIEPVGPRILADVGVRPSQPLVVMVAALDPSKDPLTFVRAIQAAWRRVPMIQAVLVGDGPLRNEVEIAIRELGLQRALHLTGWREDADRLLAAADVAVLSSLTEGLGTVVLDALSLGVPLAATETQAITEIVRHREHGLLAPVGDAEALGVAIAELLVDRRLAARLARAGLERVEAFSVDRMVAGTLRVYQDVLTDGAGGARLPDPPRLSRRTAPAAPIPSRWFELRPGDPPGTERPRFR